MTAKGRGLRDGRVTVTASPEGLVVRVEDDANDAYWVEIYLSEDELVWKLREVRRLRAVPAPPTPGGDSCTPIGPKT